MYSVDHICIATNDIEETTNFYSHTMGFEFRNYDETEDLKAAYFVVGHLVIEILQSKTKILDRPNAGAIDHLAFYVDNFNEEYERLKGLGVKMLFDEVQYYDGKKFTFISGPNGERIEISEK